MHSDYIELLYQTIRETEYYKGNEKITSYEDAMESVIDLFENVKRNRKTLFFIGNGGSSAIATHMTTDFMKNGQITTCSLFDSSVITCMGNDFGYEYIFSKPLDFLGQPDDMLIAISSSGNSANIVNAIQVARRKKMKILTLSGFTSDNKVKQLGDYNIYVPIKQYGIVESIHITLLQQIVDTIYKRDGIRDYD